MPNHTLRQAERFMRSMLSNSIVEPRYTQIVRVLIVEDERRLAENVARSLRESAGYAVDIALDGEDGLFMAGSSPYDLIVLDLMLPKMDGKTVLHKIRLSGSGGAGLVLTA